ncbi:hypothetical protein FP74_gp035 [Bacillus phage CAM003]|uniref:Uncharacterized protein n=5 Tax=Bastillevirus TaxID=1918010 RepID=A0A143FIX0_9CAUD|nr:hypothetical protein FP74_gp035 [Bacillus phage CAM003]AHZ09472.1 hypothetical protein [Bacillus phage CAM003]AMW61788.1 hypothetical protein DNAM5_37 [Bacillus phage Vinny]ASU00884.1 hypothetical protein ANTHONY_37 [Bacillus phage Anthony]
MLNFFRKKNKKVPPRKCDHDFEMVCMESKWEDAGYDFEYNTYVIAYCPKCDKEETVKEETWHKYLIKRAIKRRYQKEMAKNVVEHKG